jgi:hypothetical protein
VTSLPVTCGGPIAPRCPNCLCKPRPPPCRCRVEEKTRLSKPATCRTHYPQGFQRWSSHVETEAPIACAVTWTCFKTVGWLGCALLCYGHLVTG